jgi:SAM-dependent methyltransferase
MIGRFALFLIASCVAGAPVAPLAGKAAYDAFAAWRKSSAINPDDWSKAVNQYRNKLISDGLDPGAVTKAMAAIEAYGEAELYDRVYAEAPAFNTQPNRLLMDAIKDRRPGRALDIAMGQGRNSVYLASQGWDVTGFDVSEVGLRSAEQLAKSRAVKIRSVLSSDEDFDFGNAQWDLIAMIYAIEKRSVHRIGPALKAGGLVVIEAGHKSVSGATLEYESNELLRIFEGFRILRYEETIDVPDWGKEPIRLVRLIAEKPR